MKERLHLGFLANALRMFRADIRYADKEGYPLEIKAFERQKNDPVWL